MLEEVRQTLFKGFEVLIVQLGLGHAAVVLQGADGGDDDDGVGMEAGGAALDVEELLGAEVGGEACLGDGVVAQAHGRFRGLQGVAAVGNVGERAAVDEGGRALEGLNKVGLDGVLQERSHRALGLEVVRGDGLIVVGVGDDHLGKARLEVGEIGGQAQHRHDLAGDGDLKAVLARHAAGLAAETVDDVAELTVIHIDRALPDDAAGVDVQGVALLDVVVEHGGEQVVRCADGVEVAGEVEVDVLHRDDLGVAAARRAALDAEHGAEGGLTQADHGLLADLVERVGQADGGGGLALARGRGADGGDKDQLRLAGQLADLGKVELGLVLAVKLEVLLVDAGGSGDLSDGLHFVRLGNRNIGHVKVPPDTIC